MSNKTVDYSEISVLLENMFQNIKFEKGEINGIFEKYISDGVFKIIDQEELVNEHEESDDDISEIMEKPAKLRITKNNYVSLKQLKRNLSSESFAHLFNIISGLDSEITVIKNVLIEVLPSLFCSWHFIQEDEICVLEHAIEFYKKDKLAFHPIEDFLPRLLNTSDCDYLTLSCSYRRDEKCFVKYADVVNALDNLFQKYVLERNDNGEYRYCKW